MSSLLVMISANSFLVANPDKYGFIPKLAPRSNHFCLCQPLLP